MAIVYRIELVALDTEAGTADVLFEAASPRADRLADFAPREIEVALMETVYASEPQRVMQSVTDPAEARSDNQDGKDDAPEPQGANEIPVDEGKPKRKRRTRAEIEADKAAETAAVPAGEVHTTSGVAVVTTFEGARPVPVQVEPPAAVMGATGLPAEPAPSVEGASTASTPLTPNAMPTAPAAPFNPFAPR